MVGQVFGHKVVEALGGELNEAAHQVIEAALVLDEVRGVEVVPELHRADLTVLAEESARTSVSLGERMLRVFGVYEMLYESMNPAYAR